MKWIKLYEEFTGDIQDMITDQLEVEIRAKIEANGHFSADEYYALTKSRKLDDRMADEIFHELVGRGIRFGDEAEQVFEDENFKFTLESIEPVGEETYYWGILECPDYTYGGEEDEQETIPGKFHGRIVGFDNGMVMQDFECPDDLTIYDICEGLEHELDSFLQYVVDEIKKQK